MTDYQKAREEAVDKAMDAYIAAHPHGDYPNPQWIAAAVDAALSAFEREGYVLQKKTTEELIERMAHRFLEVYFRNAPDDTLINIQDAEFSMRSALKHKDGQP